METCELPKVINLEKHCAYCVVFTPDGQSVVSAGIGGFILVHDVASGELQMMIESHASVVYGLAITTDGLQLVWTSTDGKTRIQQIHDPKNTLVLDHPRGVPHALALSSDNQYIVTSTGHPFSELYVWCMTSGLPIHVLKGHTDVAECVGVTVFPYDLHIVSGSSDCTARVWRTSYDKKEVHKIQHPNWVNGVAETPDGQYFITSCADSFVRVFGMATGSLVYELPVNGYLKSVTISLDGRYIAAGSYDAKDSMVYVWSLIDSAAKLAVLIGPLLGTYNITFDSNGKQIALASYDKSVQIWPIHGLGEGNQQLLCQELQGLAI